MKTVDYQIVALYLTAIEEELLSEEEERALSRKVQKRKKSQDKLNELFLKFGENIDENRKEKLIKHVNVGIEAQQVLVERNRKLVVFLAKIEKRKFPQADFEELVAEGTLGLCIAAEEFNVADHDARFASYAYWWIRKWIQNAIEKSSSIRFPISLLRKSKEYTRVKYELGRELDREVTDEEIRKRMEVGEEKFASIKRTRKAFLSLHQEIGKNEDEAVNMIAFFADEKQASASEIHNISLLEETFGEAFKRLDEREKKIIFLRYGFGGEGPKKLCQIGSVLGVSRARALQLLQRALKKLGKSEDLLAFRKSS